MADKVLSQAEVDALLKGVTDGSVKTAEKTPSPTGIRAYDLTSQERIIRGRMPKALVARAKNRTGIVSDTDLIEIPLANIAVADDYTDWLLSQRGAISRGIDLEF